MFPGFGQLYLGRRVSAVLFAFPAFAAVVWVAFQFSHGLVYFAVSLLDDTYALTVMAVVAAFTAWHVASIADPFVVLRPRRIGVRVGAVLALLLLATVGMGDVVFSNAYDAYKATRQIASNDFADTEDSPAPVPTDSGSSFLPGDGATWWPSGAPTDSPTPGPTCPPSYMTARGIGSGGSADLAALLVPVASSPVAGPAFAPADAGSPAPSATPETTPSPTPETTPSPTPEATPSSSQETTPSPSPHVTPSPSPTWGTDTNSNRLTILLVGVDFISGRHHALTDTLMLVSVDLQTRAVAMVSVPRDTAAFPFYWGGQAGTTFKINTLANALYAGRLGSPDPPMVTLASEIGYLVGVKTDYYAEIDMAGFKEMIDLIGGVDINNPRLLNDPFTCTYVPAGPVHLNGSMALKFVRSRESSSDYYRAGRQQLVMMALQRKLATPAMLPKLGSLLDLAARSIATNFPLNTAKDYVDTAEHLSSISHCVLGPPYNFHPNSSLTNGTWTSRLKLDQVANLSAQLFGADSRYYRQPGVVPTPCRNSF